MTDRFELRFEWPDGTGIRDEALARTFARLEIHVGDTCVTRAFDRHTQSVVDAVHIPLLPVAAWVADALWTACCESPESPEVRSVRTTRNQRERHWSHRHGWLSSREGMALPELIFSRADVGHVRLDWFAQADTFEPMPLWFLGSGRAVVPRDIVMAELLRLVEATVARCDGITTGPVTALRARCELLLSAPPEERLVCERAARMGLDAYDPAEVDEELAELLTGDVAAFEPMLGDLLDVAESPQVAPLREQLRSLDALVTEAREAAHHGTPAPALAAARGLLRAVEGWPHEQGYARARALRSQVLGLNDAHIADPLDEVIHERLLPRVDVRESGEPFVFRGIRAFVANWQDVPFVVTRPARAGEQRFARARALHALIAADTPRLVTAAFDADQQASRAFAAELLAPAEDIRSRLTSRFVDSDDLEALAGVYRVSPRLIRHQIENHQLGEIVDG